jgi:redox-sensitive bicupin YhaK (pirin superfamily)
VTFVVEGVLTHRDSAGHESVIHAGGVQWMTAGKGLIHAEISPLEFKQIGGPLEILQLWVHLPSRLKMVEPRYVGLQRHEIPAIETDDGRATVNLIAGQLGDRRGPIESLTGVFMSTVELEPGGRVRFGGLGGRSIFLYVVRGDVRIGGQEVSAFTLAEMEDAGDILEIEAISGAIALFGHAEPIGEPVVSMGPFVMNTEAEIRQAIHDYHSGRFGTSAAG